MMTRSRADLGFSDTADALDLSDFAPDPQPQTRQRPEAALARAVAERTGFSSREAAGQGGSTPAAAPVAPPQADPVPVRRRRTGRNAQFNLKARPDTIAAFCAVADQQGWGLGETLEYAVALLEREYRR
ncbi:hypothetical protein ACOI1H_14335 [Loktanella sp. DJP18]|uniref:hypothetical protein n=1 Tax=Loktanella sp. DJP18 TaxID=3409788 RepID=UPI003BB4F080